MRFWRKSRFLLSLLALIFLLSPLAGQNDFAAAAESDDTACVRVPLSMTAEQTMPVPSFCISGLCKLVVYLNANMGAFAPGYAMEVYYYQWAADGFWIAGPNITLGGVSFSDGFGYNGNGAAKGVFLGGTTSDGGYVRIMDDGDNENSADDWTIQMKSSPTLTQASLHVCAIPDAEARANISTSTAIDMPDFCVDDLCMVLRFSYGQFGDFGPGFLLPVFYDQDGVSNDWIGGPSLSLAGVSFASSAGENGDGAGMTPILDGGTSDGGGYARLLDDGAEWSNSEWSVRFQSGSDLTSVYYFIAPMTCTKHAITNQYTDLSVPGDCVDGLCTIVRWTDAFMGAWGPGFVLPVHYRQDSQTGAWLGGPALCMGGQCFSDGSGVNGDSVERKVFNTGYTTPHGGSVILWDDRVAQAETWTGEWEVVLDKQDDLTAAAYYICSNTCQMTEFLINGNFLPFVVQAP